MNLQFFYIKHTKTRESASEKYTVMMGACCLINAPHWCARQHWKGKKRKAHLSLRDLRDVSSRSFFCWPLAIDPFLMRVVVDLRFRTLLLFWGGLGMTVSLAGRYNHLLSGQVILCWRCRSFPPCFPILLHPCQAHNLKRGQQWTVIQLTWLVFPPTETAGRQPPYRSNQRPRPRPWFLPEVARQGPGSRRVQERHTSAPWRHDGAAADARDVQMVTVRWSHRARTGRERGASGQNERPVPQTPRPGVPGGVAGNTAGTPGRVVTMISVSHLVSQSVDRLFSQ